MPNNIQFLLDCSGSMGSVQTQAVEGFDGFVERVRAAHIKGDLEVVFFDDDTDVVYKGDLTLIASIENAYRIRGGTHLWDAIGHAINHKLPAPPPGNTALEAAGLGSRHRFGSRASGPGLVPYTGDATRKDSKDQELLRRLGVDPAKVHAPAKPMPWRPPNYAADNVVRELCVVGTDGEDMGSPDYSEGDILKLVEQREAAGNFTFIWIAIGKGAQRPPWVHAGNMLAFDDPKRLAGALDKLAAATVHFLSSGAESTETFFLTEGKP